MGWSYDFWRENFYPENLEPKKFLSYYAQQFDTVEVDSTFYRIPRTQTVIDWKEQTPKDFLFSLKFPQIITHVKMLKDSQEETKVFIERAELLQEKLRTLATSISTFLQERACSPIARILEKPAKETPLRGGSQEQIIDEHKLLFNPQRKQCRTRMG